MGAPELSNYFILPTSAELIFFIAVAGPGWSSVCVHGGTQAQRRSRTETPVLPGIPNTLRPKGPIDLLGVEFFFKTIYFKPILNIYNSCRNRTEFPYIPQPTSLKITILHNLSIIITDMILSSVQYWQVNYRLYLTFPIFLTNVLFFFCTRLLRAIPHWFSCYFNLMSSSL